MTEDIYEKLRSKIDHFAIGVPATQSGIELKILKKLYSLEDAQLFLELNPTLEEPASVATRTGRDLIETAEQLETMAKKGLVFRLRRGKSVRYAMVPFVVGSYEFQLKRMDRELAEMMELYLEEGFLSQNMVNNVTPIRTVPVKKSLQADAQVAPYEDAREIVKKQKVISVATCICQRQQELLDQACDKPMEVCLAFGSHADFYVENEMARYIDVDEALKILDQCDEAGLVNQPVSTVNPGGMCNCCGDCCGILRGLKKLDNPAKMIMSNYYARVDEQECSGCEVCIDRCQMEAITMDDDLIAQINLNRCIGCGLCVTTCDSKAMLLERKSADQLQIPPASNIDLVKKTFAARGITF